eukprot:scaffold609475_cov19-Prasinocladus_malaysianus.AAC.1
MDLGQKSKPACGIIIPMNIWFDTERLIVSQVRTARDFWIRQKRSSLCKRPYDGLHRRHCKAHQHHLMQAIIA